MRRARRRNRPEPDVVDLRTDETIDLRSDSTAPAEYHLMRVWHDVPPVRDPAADDWERSASFVAYPADLVDQSTDRRRDSIEPGPPSAAVLGADLEADEVGKD